MARGQGWVKTAVARAPRLSQSVPYACMWCVPFFKNMNRKMGFHLLADASARVREHANGDGETLPSSRRVEGVS